MIHAKEIHEPLRTGLERTLNGRVHSVFERVINFQDDSGGMHALLAHTLDRGPDAVLLDIGRLDNLGITPGDRITGNAESLSVGGLLVDLGTARSYALKLPSYRPDALALRQGLDEARRRIGSLPSEGSTPFLSLMEDMVEQRRLELQEAMRQEDLEACVRMGRRLLGLGQGLTPTGDDILLGLFCVVLMEKSPLESLRAFPEALLEGAEGLTNDLSLWGLKRAAKGQVRERVSGFVKDLAQGNAVRQSLEVLLEIGHSSGRDIATGVLTGFELVLERADENGR